MEAWRNPNRKFWLFAVILAGFSALTGCTVGPHYARPTATVPPAYREEPPGWKTAQPSDQIAKGKWWEIYQDPQLNALEEKVNVSNQTLKASVAQFEQARAMVHQFRADYYPTVTAGASGSRNRLSQNRALTTTATPYDYTDLQIPAVGVSYEPDLFGRIRKTVEEARSNAQASAGDLENVSLSVHAELAVDYFQLRTLDAEEQLLRDTVGAYQKALELTQNRYSGGVASGVDVAQAQTILETTRAQMIDLQVARAQFEHAAAVLVGEPPSTFSISFAPWNAPPPVTPAGVPSDLMERRPDIAAAERRVAAANAQIGVARAGYFPVLNIFGSGGFESSTITNLITGPSGFLSLGASAVVTAFDAGRRRAISDEAKAAYDQSVANYRQTLLTSFQEVEDNLAALRILEQEAKTQQDAVAASEHSLDLSTTRYKGGVTTYLEVTTAQELALSDERVAVEILSRRMTASVQLIQALGGGWDASSLNKIQMSSTQPAQTQPAQATPTQVAARP
jgi:NodT family efflux transporter outer membrane factor (OMF) lipoprotein